MVAPPTAPAATTANAIALSRGDVVGSSTTGAFSTTSEATTTSFGDVPFKGVISSDRCETVEESWLPSTKDLYGNQTVNLYAIEHRVDRNSMSTRPRTGARPATPPHNTRESRPGECYRPATFL